MSLQQSGTVTCPQCGLSTRHESYSSVNVTRAPEIRTQVLDRSLFRFTCPGCGISANVVDALLYHDMDRKLMIQLVPEGSEFSPEAIDEPQRRLGPEIWELIRSITTRVVRNQNDLVDKILIFEAGLDDRLVECFKFRLKVKQPADFPALLFFRELTDDAVVLAHVHDGEVRHFRFAMSDWRAHEAALIRRLEPINADRWLIVDLGHARFIYERVAAGSR